MLILLDFLLIFVGYLIGREHEWLRHKLEQMKKEVSDDRHKEV